MRRALQTYGAFLCLGALGHWAGVSRLYFVQGVPEPRRVAFDAWIGAFQLVVGLLNFAAVSVLARDARAARWFVAVGALLIIFYGVFAGAVVLPAGGFFAVPPIAYPAIEVAMLIAVWRSTRRPT